MKKNIIKIISLVACTVPVTVMGQSNESITFSPQYKEGKYLYSEGNYAAAMIPLKDCLRLYPESTFTPEVEYMIACSAYELKDKNSTAILRNYLERNPDSPYAYRVYALIASNYFFEEKYDEALALYNSSNLEKLADTERADMLYRMAIAYMKTGNSKEAAIWFATLKETSSKYEADCTYYISYIRYTQQRYDEALEGFLSLRNNLKYKELAPYYTAEIYLLQKQYAPAQEIALNYLSSYPSSRYSEEMQRILGETYYQTGDYHRAIQAFEKYTGNVSAPRRDALYMLGLSYFHTNVYSKAASTLGEVTTADDALTQNAYLHMGFAYLQLADKNKARMAFEQAARSNADLKTKEQAAYNYALTIHETSFSGFGESVTAFENFLNQFPQSAYAEKVSEYLIDVYMSTRSYEAALKSIERISAPGERIMEAKQRILFQLGTQAFANSQYDEASAYLNRSIQIGQYNAQTKAEALYWKGEIDYRTQRYQSASDNFRSFLDLTANRQSEMYTLAHYNLGYIAFNLKNYQQAESWFTKYMQLEKATNRSTLADANNRLGDCNFHVRNFNAAKQYYAKARSMGGASADYSYYQLALVSGLQKDYNGKITLLNQLTEQYPESPYVINGLYEKGRSYVQLGNNKQAINAFRELANKFPENALSRKAAAEIGLLHYQNEEYSQAIEAYKLVATQYPGSEEAKLALRDLKSIYTDINKVDEFAAVVSSLPGDIHFDVNEQDSLTYIAAERIFTRKQIPQAKESFTKYLQSFPAGAYREYAHYYLARIGQEQNDEEAVLTHTARILELNGSRFTEEALVMRAELLYKRQQYAEALPLYKQLKAHAGSVSHRLTAQIGIIRSAYKTKNDADVIHAATSLLVEEKITPEVKNEVTYYRAKAYLNQKADGNAMNDLKTLAKDTRNVYGAEAKYLVGQILFDQKDYAAAEKEILDFIDQSTPHTYWLARGFVLLSDIYMATNKKLDARQYLLSLQQNYQANDDIKGMIESRLNKLK